MSSNTPGDAPRREMPEGLRPFPAHPSLEFERKRAKKLLREMQRGNPAAQLSDAQFAAAREYGFSSWPRLVEYFKTLERHQQSGPPAAWYPLEFFENRAAGLCMQHSRGYAHAALELATFVPRFYGKPVTTVLESAVSIEDARLVVARENRYASWETFVEYVRSNAEEHDQWTRVGSPMSSALKAIRNADLDSLGQILDAHTELLTSQKPQDAGKNSDLLCSAISIEWKSPNQDARRITDWIVGRGADLQSALNRALLTIAYGYHRSPENRGSTEEYLEFLIQRGADPNWMPPNGLTLLEHALLRPIQSREIAEAFLLHVKPRKAFWIAAALGDTASLKGYFDKYGKLTPEARKHRPDFTAAGPFSLPQIPDADDIDIMWEAFYVAVQHQRFESMDVLLDHGLPVDYAPWGKTMMGHATNARDVELVEYLLRRGAVQDIQGATAEQMDQWLYDGPPTDPKVLRIYEMCGGKNADEVIRRYESRSVAPPQMVPALRQAIELAKDEAARLGQEEVQPENLFYALFRDERHMPLPWLIGAGVDPEVFKRAIEHRLLPKGEILHDVPFSASATEVLTLALSAATERRRTVFTTFDLLGALIKDDAGTATRIVVAAGADLAKLRASLAKD